MEKAPFTSVAVADLPRRTVAPMSGSPSASKMWPEITLEFDPGCVLLTTPPLRCLSDSALGEW